jgi:dolichol-phosphate mannosyltransferase
MKRLSFVVPVFNEELNLEVLHRELSQVVATMKEVDPEIFFVDDHSTDASPEILKRLAAVDPRVHWVRLSRNSGMHLACSAGMHEASGDAVVVLAADLQDPPEIVKDLYREWVDGAQIVWAVRVAREGVPLSTRLSSRCFFWLLKRISPVETPKLGDVLLADRVVVDAFCSLPERNLSFFAVIQWMGFRQRTVPYVKRARRAGRSNFGFRRRVGLALDSFTGFSKIPLRLATFIGFTSAAVGLCWALYILIGKLMGIIQATGFASIMITILVLVGGQMVMMGIFGEYLWRTLEESRRRPQYFVESASHPPRSSPSRSE